MELKEYETYFWESMERPVKGVDNMPALCPTIRADLSAYTVPDIIPLTTYLPFVEVPETRRGRDPMLIAVGTYVHELRSGFTLRVRKAKLPMTVPLVCHFVFAGDDQTGIAIAGALWASHPLLTAIYADAFRADLDQKLEGVTTDGDTQDAAHVQTGRRPGEAALARR